MPESAAVDTVVLFDSVLLEKDVVLVILLEAAVRDSVVVLDSVVMGHKVLKASSGSVAAATGRGCPLGLQSAGGLGLDVVVYGVAGAAAVDEGGADHDDVRRGGSRVLQGACGGREA